MTHTRKTAKMADKKIAELATAFEALKQKLSAQGEVATGISQTVSEKLATEAANKRPKAQSVLQMFAPPPFLGQIQEDGQDFITRFLIYAQQAKYEGDDMVPLAVCFLKDKALQWYEALEDGSPAKTTYDGFSAAFIAKFAPKNLSYAERQELLLRTQGKDEDVELYIYDIQKRFERCATPEAERFHIFVKGLSPAIRSKLLEKDVQTFKAACTEAINIQKVNKLTKVYEKEATSAAQTANIGDGSTTEKSLKEADDLMSGLRTIFSSLGSLSDTAKASVRSATQAQGSSKPRSGTNKLRHRPVRNVQSNRPIQPRHGPNQANRSAIICYHCQIPGHKRSECRKYKAEMNRTGGQNRSGGQNRRGGPTFHRSNSGNGPHNNVANQQRPVLSQPRGPSRN
jgi:hypothetical protein